MAKRESTTRKPPEPGKGRTKASPGGRQESAGYTEGTSAAQIRNRITYAFAQKALTVSIFSIAIGMTGILIGGLGLLAKPEPVYFGVQENGQIIPMRPLSDPVRSEAQVLNWASKAVTESLTMDFRRYRDQLTGARKFFTDEGFDQFILALRESGNLDSIKKNRYLVDAVLNGGPRISWAGERNGVFYWKIHLPVLISYHGGGRSKTQEAEIVLLVRRVSAAKNPHGMGIQQFVQKGGS